MKTSLLGFCLLSFVPYINAFDWDILLNKYKPVMGEDVFMLLSKQYEAYTQNNAPTIAHNDVKKIPILENNDPVINLNEVHCDRIKVISDDDLLYLYEKIEDADYRSPNHMKMRKNVFECLQKMVQELDILAPLFGYEQGELEIKLFEGLRDIDTQKNLFDTKMTSLIKEHNISQDQAYVETSKWLSPYKNNVPVHSTGGAIDIGLWSNKLNNFCDMGPFNTSGDTSPIFSTFTSEKQRANRMLFLIAATRAGLTNYLYEFWHFSYGDRYAAYWRSDNSNDAVAIYDAL